MDSEQPEARIPIPSERSLNWRAWLPTRGTVLFVLIVAGALLFYVRGAGAVPGASAPAAASTSVIPYQGRLADAGGVALTGTYSMTFNLYNIGSGGSPLWSEAWTSGNSVLVTNGLFNVMLGSLAPITPTVFASNGSLWLGVTVGADSEMAPRVQLGSAPFALEAQHARVADQSNAYYPLLRPQSVDLTDVDPSLTGGFQGGFTDGRYGYLVPGNNGGIRFGKVARVDLQNFTASNINIIVLDLTTVDPGLKGFIGGFTDGSYGYFVPNNASSSGKVARVDLQNFSAGGVITRDLALVDSDLIGFDGGFTDGTYGYFVPNINGGGASGKVARVVLSNFSTGNVDELDLTGVDASLKGFAGGFTDGHFGYFVPNNGSSSGKVARVDLQNFNTSGVAVLDLTTKDRDLKGFEGGFSDGRYSYFVPYYNGTYFGKVARVDLQNFTTSGVTVLDLTLVDPDLKGFIGGFTDGRYGYFAPNTNGSAPFGKVARVDLQNFTTSGVAVLDLANPNAGLKGFQGGFTDGRYGYFLPAVFSKVARIQLFSGAGSP